SSPAEFGGRYANGAPRRPEPPGRAPGGPEAGMRPRPASRPVRFDLRSEFAALAAEPHPFALDRESTRLNSSHVKISYAVFCLTVQIDHRKFTSFPSTTLFRCVFSGRMRGPVREWRSAASGTTGASPRRTGGRNATPAGVAAGAVRSAFGIRRPGGRAAPVRAVGAGRAARRPVRALLPGSATACPADAGPATSPAAG